MTFHLQRLSTAIKASLIHLSMSLVVAFAAAALVFLLWYPYPYRELVGGLQLFLLVVGVDVVCGPLLTFVVFNPTKPRSELVRDLTMIALIQMAALIYGLHAIAVARPVHMVFEVDRLRVVTATEVRQEDLDKARPPWNKLNWTGPTIISARDPLSSAEMMESLDLSLQGNEPSQRAHWWQDYEKSVPAIIKASKPLNVLRKKHISAVELINQTLVKNKLSDATVLWIPLTSFKNTEWVALIDAKTARPIDYLPLDGF